MRKFTLALAAKDAVKKVEKAVGARGSTLGNIDSLVNKRLASFRNAEKTLAGAKALVQTYRAKYPQLAITSRKAQWNAEYTSAQLAATGGDMLAGNEGVRSKASHLKVRA
jgi:hypothetical protein